MSTLTPADTSGRLARTGFIHLDGVLYASYTTKDFATASELVTRIGIAADAMNHHPDISLGYGSIDVELTSHDAGGVTGRDIALATAIQDLADAAGAEIVEQQPARYELAIDTVDADGIRDFWRVGLDYEERATGDSEASAHKDIVLVDPRGRGPTVWFQHMEPPRTDRNRIHLDVYVPTAEAEARVQAVLAAGGTLMTDEFAPDWWVLADVEGNELCVCTSGR